MKRHLTILATGAAILIATAACSSGPPPSRAGSSAPPLSSQDKFSQCMAEHGAPIQAAPAQGPAQPGTQAASASVAPGDPQKQQQALEQCRKFLPNRGQPNKVSPAMLDQLRTIAKCMRAAGVPYPDPDPNQVGGPGTMKVPDGLDVNNPAIRAKLTACMAKAGFGGHPSGAPQDGP